MDDPIEGGQIRSIVERVQRLQEEKRTIEDDIKEVYAEARANGFDVKVLRAVVKHLGKDQSEVSEFEAIFDLYLEAFTNAPRAHGASRATRTREDKPSTYPERIARPVQNANPDSLTAAQSEAAAGSTPEQGADARAVGEGDLDHSAQSVQFAMPSGAGEGIAHPADPAPAADAKPRFILPPAKPLRPHCLKPEACGGTGAKHCFTCTQAASEASQPAYEEA